MARRPTEAQVELVFNQYLDSEKVAELLGTVSAATVRSYALRKLMPAPKIHIGRTPLWDRDEVLAWAAQRPGQGAGGGRPRGSGKKVSAE